MGQHTDWARARVVGEGPALPRRVHPAGGR